MAEGRPHPIQGLVQEVRGIFLELGFDEIENQLFIPEEDVYKQYGSEAPVILDRVYYLAGLERPDIGLSEGKISKIKNIKPNFNISEFMKILREYREGLIEGDDLLEDMVNRLGITTEEASKVLDIIPQFKEIQPVPSKTTLRSHMTAAWFPTLQALQGRSDLPLKLFSVGLRFRREQRVDASHLRAHYGGSMVLMGSDVDLDAGRKTTDEILSKLGFKNLKFVQKKATSNYYEQGSEYEVYSGKLEIADIGMYSKKALGNYGIKYPVFNLGFGLERVLMVRHNYEDIREVMYPQFYSKLELTDQEIAEQVRIENTPETKDGKKLVEKIIEVTRGNADASAPCEYLVYEGDFNGKKIQVKLVEKEDNTKLLGPAALNEVYVHDGNIYGIPKDMSKLKFDVSEVKEKGVNVDFGFLDAVANLFAWTIEKDSKEDWLDTEKEKGRTASVKMAKSPFDVNIDVSEQARNYITSKNKIISLKGPVFTAVEYTIL